jgi:hypothetical protein
MLNSDYLLGAHATHYLLLEMSVPANVTSIVLVSMSSDQYVDTVGPILVSLSGNSPPVSLTIEVSASRGRMHVRLLPG